MATSDSRERRESPRRLHERAVAGLDVEHQAADPSAIFLLMIDAQMSGMLSTVPVTSRSA